MFCVPRIGHKSFQVIWYWCWLLIVNICRQVINNMVYLRCICIKIFEMIILENSAIFITDMRRNAEIINFIKINQVFPIQKYCTTSLHSVIALYFIFCMIRFTYDLVWNVWKHTRCDGRGIIRMSYDMLKEFYEYFFDPDITYLIMAFRLPSKKRAIIYS